MTEQSIFTGIIVSDGNGKVIGTVSDHMLNKLGYIRKSEVDQPVPKSTEPEIVNPVKPKRTPVLAIVPEEKQSESKPKKRGRPAKAFKTVTRNPVSKGLTTLQAAELVLKKKKGEWYSPASIAELAKAAGWATKSVNFKAVMSAALANAYDNQKTDWLEWRQDSRFPQYRYSK